MKRIIMALIFAFVAGICFGQYTVAIVDEPETITRLLETSIAKLGYTITDRAATDEAKKKYGIMNLIGLGQELNADFVIYVTSSPVFFISTFDIKAENVVGGGVTRLLITEDEKSNQILIDNYIFGNIGTEDMQQEYQQKRAEAQEKLAEERQKAEKEQREADKKDAWRNRGIYMSAGGGVGFSTGGAIIDGKTYSGSGPVSFTAPLRFDIGFNEKQESAKGYEMWFWGLGIGLFLSGADGNISFMVPIEFRSVTRYDILELGLGAGLGLGFGGGAFSMPFIIDGSIGWKAGPGILFFESLLSFSFVQTGKNSGGFGFSGSVIMGYRIGLGGKSW